MGWATSYPFLEKEEFEAACEDLAKRHIGNDGWVGAECRESHGTKFTRITKAFENRKSFSDQVGNIQEEVEINEEDDDEALSVTPLAKPVIRYDIILSPTYRVPTFYISIKDPLHRFPPTMSTLYQNIIPQAFRSQTKDFGVLGGITITDHLLEGTPVFFVHPCHTAEVMEAVAGGRRVEIEEYLILLIGALGKYIGLDVPMDLAVGSKIN